MATPSFFSRRTLRGLVSFLSRSSKHTQPQVLDEGVTLIECLVAIAVIALATAMITPPLFIAAATRMQNQRAEQALQLAQGEVEQIRLLVDRGFHIPAKLPPISAVPDLSATPAPTGLINRLRSVNQTCNTYDPYADRRTYSRTLALPVDVSGDCQPDFMVQQFRTAGTTPAGEAPPRGQGRPSTFRLGVRVYASNAINNWSNLRTDAASLQFTNGEGNQRTRPLAVLYVSLNWSDQEFSLCQFQTSDPRRTCPQQ